MLNRNTSLLAGMSDDQARAALAKAQAAYVDLATGSHGVSFSYNRICIGRSYIGPENWFNGYIKKLIYWPAALTKDEMEHIVSYQ